jgi:hypothetical protein
MRFSYLLAGAVSVAAVLATPTLSADAGVKDKRAGKFLFTGVNVAGAEFGNKNLPGRLGKDYTWPTKSAIDVSSFRLIMDLTTKLTHDLDASRHRNEHFPNCFHDVSRSTYKSGIMININPGNASCQISCPELSMQPTSPACRMLVNPPRPSSPNLRVL